MARRRRQLTRKRILYVLLVVTILAIALPTRITGHLINLVQVVLPFQDLATRSADRVGELWDDSPKADISAEDWEKAQLDNQGLRHQVVTLSHQLLELQRDYAVATRVRNRGLSQGRLIPSRVVAADALPYRQSRLVNSGTLSGVRAGAAVLTDAFTLDLRGSDGVKSGMSVLAGEALVGFVEQVGTHAARVRLLSDPQTKMPVLCARMKDGNYSPLEAEFWLVGAGDGRIEVRDVDHRYIREGAIQKGDVVLTVADHAHLPASMNVGTITELRQDPDNALIYTLEVTPAIDYDKLRKVLVLDPYGTDDQS